MYRAVALCALVLLISLPSSVQGIEIPLTVDGRSGFGTAADGYAADSAAARKLAAVVQQASTAAASKAAGAVDTASVSKPAVAAAAAALKPAPAKQQQQQPAAAPPKPATPQKQQVAQQPAKPDLHPAASAASVSVAAQLPAPKAPKPTIPQPAAPQPVALPQQPQQQPKQQQPLLQGPKLQQPSPAATPSPARPQQQADPQPPAAASAPAEAATEAASEPAAASETALDIAVQAEAAGNYASVPISHSYGHNGPVEEPGAVQYPQYTGVQHNKPLGPGPDDYVKFAYGNPPGNPQSPQDYTGPYPDGHYGPHAGHPQYPRDGPWAGEPYHPKDGPGAYAGPTSPPAAYSSPPSSKDTSYGSGTDKGVDSYDSKSDKYGEYDFDKADNKKGNHMHHTGKAANKLHKGDDSNLSENDAGYSTDSKGDKEYEKYLRLQKYYRPEDEQDQEDAGVSTYAKPSHYSSKAAKYAALALKAEQKAHKAASKNTLTVNGKPVASTQQNNNNGNKPGLSSLAAALMKGVGGNKANALSTPKPKIKGRDSAATTQGEPAALEGYPYDGYPGSPGNYDNYDNYEGYESYGSYDSYGGDDKNKTVVVITNEQYHKGKDKHKKGGTKPASQHVSIHLDGKDHGYGPYDGGYDGGYEGGYDGGYEGGYDGGYGGYDGYDGDGYGGYDGEYDGYGPEGDSGRPHKKHKKPERRDQPFDMDHNYQPPLRKKEERNTYNFRSCPDSEIITVGYTQGSGGTLLASYHYPLPTTNHPVVISYETSLTCGAPPGPAGGIGHCYGSGIMLNQAARQVHMYFTCTIDADASNMCGLKYVQGMTITAQGIVQVDLDATAAKVTRLQADVLPITGVYVPGRRTTLLADVVTLMSGVKGGSLMLRSDGNRNGKFSFYFWR